MICRLVIITIIIANLSNDFILQYSLITACIIIDLIHEVLKPYSNPLLNDFDGTILHFIVLVSVLPMVEFFDNFDTNLSAGITFILVILPLLILITMSMKKRLRSLPRYWYIKFTQIKKLPGYCCRLVHLRNYNELPLNEVEESSDEEEYDNVIDDSKRVNATICYSYITSTSRISLLLHETEGEARGRVLITMISYKCL